MEHNRPLIKVAVWCSYTSGVVSVFGIAFLFAFVLMGDPMGRLNDIAVIVQYSLMLPIAIALYQILREFDPSLNLVALFVGIPGMLAVIILQILLVTGLMAFSVQIGLVVIAFLVVLIWFIYRTPGSLNGEVAKKHAPARSGRAIHWLPNLGVLVRPPIAVTLRPCSSPQPGPASAGPLLVNLDRIALCNR